MEIHRKKRKLAGVILAGGTLVVASYLHGILTHPLTKGSIWGGVPQTIRPLYSVSMILAALGFFLFTGFIFFRVNAGQTRVARRYRFEAFTLLYLMILIPSALWMPLTFAMLESPSQGLWWAIRAGLILVGAGSVLMFPALLTLRPVKRGWPFALAILGLTFFALQTAILDALVWPAYFPFRP
jgi:hypothetical protein